MIILDCLIKEIINKLDKIDNETVKLTSILCNKIGTHEYVMDRKNWSKEKYVQLVNIYIKVYGFILQKSAEST